MTFRSLLFVPGNRPERFEKALGAGADAVCFDLEDAVAPEAKDAARAAVIDFLSRGGRAGLGVRINGPASEHLDADCRALSGLPVAFVMIPKVESPGQVASLSLRLGDARPLWPIIESPEGLRQAWDIASAVGVGGVLFGAADYSAEVGCTLEWDALLYARGALAAAAARAGVELLDVPYLDIADETGLADSTGRAKALGFTGRACIHPGQVEIVNTAYTPAAAEVDRARRIVSAFDASNGGAALLEGKLIELPVVRAARRTLERTGV
ncbi:HpcH/HpaI aldolase/citrate lyase family protein [Phenylobacterium sp.]|jgi:citrate lyase subunit beta/citryl-CoA lyase/(S)-citramalyl-CoA lyase|uniref:HpcH/HpaI aldolase/citrate lyase family protein n=1 Tax=Phenylobacterium sp. TaxID=1871053 RepID=UPI0037CB2DC6